LRLGGSARDFKSRTGQLLWVHCNYFLRDYHRNALKLKLIRPLKYYINLGAPPIRTIADGNEPFMRPEVGFNPSWFHKYCNIDFSEKWHKDVGYRFESYQSMKNEIKKRFPGYNIGRVNEDEPPDLLTGIYGIGIMDSIFGRPLAFYSDKWSVPVGEKMGEKDIDSLSVPNMDNHPFLEEIFNEIDKIYRLTGSAKGYLNWQGNLNTAFRFRGDQIFTDFFVNPHLANKLLDVISDTYIEGVKRLYKKQNEYGIDYTFATIANCTINMAGPVVYSDTLLAYDVKIAGQFETIGIHNCAWTVTPYIDLYKKVPGVGYIDMGIDSDMLKVREVFPEARRNCLYTSSDLKNKSNEQIKKDFETIARQLAPCDVGLPDIEYDVPDDKIMYAMDLCEYFSDTIGGT
jgi:hypothetical protein